MQLRGVIYKKLTAKEKLPTTRAGQALRLLKKGGSLGFYVHPASGIITVPSKEFIVQKGMAYPLIAPYAFARINYDKKDDQLVYNVAEPKLSEREATILQKLKEGFIQMIDIRLEDIEKKQTLIGFLEKNVKKIIDSLNIKISETEYSKIMYYIYRDYVGLNRIEPLLADPYIEDIACDGTNVPIYIVHQKLGSMKTSVLYTDEKELKEFVTKLAERCDRYISYAEPLLDGSLKDGTRVQASLTSDVTTRGPTFSLRKFKEDPFSPADMIRLNTASSEMMAYLWYVVERGANILIAGGVATGKTSILNSISIFIPPEAKIVSIEDTRELALPHENWIPGVSRMGFTGTGTGEVTMFELLRESFRQNPDYLIVGEVRSKEAYVMFQGMASIPGYEKVAVLNDDHLKFVPIAELANRPYKTFTMDTETGKINIVPVKARVVHKPQSVLYKITTKSGREIQTTEYHSLFTFNNGIRAVEASKFKKGDVIIIPAKTPTGFADMDYLDMTELENVRIFSPEYLRKAMKNLGYNKASKICGVKSISDYYANFKRANPASMKADKFFNLMKEANIEIDKSKLQVKFLRKSRLYPATLKITPQLLRLIGYYISEGNLNKSGKNSRIALYNKNKEILEDMRKCIFAISGKKPRERITKGYGTCTELAFSHKVIFELLMQKCGNLSQEKRIPDFIYGLSKEKIGEFLTALFNGDGYFSKHKFGYYTSSRELANGLAQLLLAYGIVARIITRKSRNHKNKYEYDLMFYRRNEREEFLKFVKPIRKNWHGIQDTKKISKKDKFGDVFLDTIKSIEKIQLDKPITVYDLVVPGTQNFMGGFGGICLHNSGHPSMSTMHAGSVDDLMKRLQTKPISLSPGLLESLDIVMIMIHAREKGKSARRVKEIVEIRDIDKDTGTARTNKVFSWLPSNDEFEYRGNSWVLNELAKQSGASINDVIKEVSKRKIIIEWMVRNNITKMTEVAKYIYMYYKNPAKFDGIIKGENPERIER